MNGVRFFLVLTLVTALTMPALAKKQKTAVFKDNVLNDQKLNFTLEIPEEPAILRAVLLKKNYKINKEVKELGGDFTIPEIQIYARLDEMTPAEFRETLEKNIQSHNSEDDIITKLNLILSGEFLGKEDIELDGIPAIHALFKRNYTRRLQGDPSDPRYRQYGGVIIRSEHDVHEVLILKQQDYLVVIHGFSEREFYPQNREEFAKIFNSLKFIDDTDQPLGESSEK
jgi:hypothetical protein